MELHLRHSAEVAHFVFLVLSFRRQREVLMQNPQDLPSLERLQALRTDYRAEAVRTLARIRDLERRQRGAGR
eukprot:6437741-Heterocapsa_arctica.AAC.1